jgi:uncharacterized RDD family membrane protein YckC
VTCPKCGFVSFPGLTECKKCGHRFVSGRAKPDASAPLSKSLGESPAAKAREEEPVPTPPAFSPVSEPSELPEIPAEPVIQSGAQAAPWREELAGRLEDHRKRRSRLRSNFDPGGTLDLAFGEAANGEEAEVLDAELIESPGSGDGIDLPISGSQDDVPILDSVPLEKPVDDVRVLTSAAVEAGEAPLIRPELESEPVEIILESSPATSPAANPRRVQGSKHVAPLGRRFMAGLIDTLVLLIGVGLFALIFWVVGGHASRNPLNLVILGSITTLFVLAYFGIFTALSSSTPGLLWMDLEVQSLEGGAPSPRESFWRAFGYLVSFTSLLLGFVWAAVDSDHLTWHDHMSGTFITNIER